jgi:hypothetical protein
MSLRCSHVRAAARRSVQPARRASPSALSLLRYLARMAAGGLPELDVARVQRWCASQVSERLRAEIRIECDIAPRHLTISECRPPWHEDLGPEWTRFPVALALRQD